MQNRRVRGAAVSIILLIFILGLSHWWGLIRLPLLPVTPAEAIPATVPLVAAFPQGSLLWPDSGAALAEGPLDADLRLCRAWLDSLTIPWRARPLWLAMQPVGERGAAVTLLLDGERGGPGPAERLADLTGHSVTRSVYRNRPVFRITTAGGDSLCLARFRNLWIFGRYPFQVEEAIGRLRDRPSALHQRRSFRKVWEPPGEGALQLYFSPDGLADLPGALPADLAALLEQNLTTGALRLQEDASGWEVTGVLLPGNAVNWQRALDQQGVVLRPERILSVLPASLHRLTWWSPADPADFVRALPEKGNDRFASYVLPWWSEEGALAAFLPAGGGQASSFFVARAYDPGLADSLLQAYGREVGVLEQYRYQAFDIYRLLEEDPLGPLSAFCTTSLRNPYYTRIGAYVVFASSRSALEVWIDQYTVGHTLDADPRFQFWYARNPGDAQAFFLWDTDQPGAGIGPFPVGPARAAFRGGFAGFQVRLEGGLLRLWGRWTPPEAPERKGPEIRWKHALGAPVRTPPSVLRFIPDGAPFVAVQDEADHLYLLDRDGRQRWRRRLDGPLLSEVRVLPDFPGRGPLLLCNTARSIYLLDENGADQGAFPLQLQAEAGGGVTATDFEGDGDYAFFVGGAREGIYGFDRQGRPLPGWNPRRETGRVRFPLLHFQHDNRDYLVGLNEAGVLHVFARDGTHRWPPLPADTSALSPPDYQLHPWFDRIVFADRRGVCHVTDLEGQSFRMRLATGDPTAVRFAYADVTGDARKDYLTLNGRDLTVHFYDGNDLLRRRNIHRFEQPPEELFAVDSPREEKALIGVARPASGQIWLMDGTGTLWEGFPLGGDTTFRLVDLYGNGEMTLVVGMGEGVVAYGM